MSRWIIMLGGYDDLGGIGFVLPLALLFGLCGGEGKDKSSTRIFWFKRRFGRFI